MLSIVLSMAVSQGDFSSLSMVHQEEAKDKFKLHVPHIYNRII